MSTKCPSPHNHGFPQLLFQVKRTLHEKDCWLRSHHRLLRTCFSWTQPLHPVSRSAVCVPPVCVKGQRPRLTLDRLCCLSPYVYRLSPPPACQHVERRAAQSALMVGSHCLGSCWGAGGFTLCGLHRWCRCQHRDRGRRCPSVIKYFCPCRLTNGAWGYCAHCHPSASWSVDH